MKTTTLALLGLGTAIAVVALVRSTGGPPADDDLRYQVTGIVVAAPVGPAVEVAHDDIPGFMPAMTMPFALKTPAEATGLEPGDRVRFTLRVGERESWAEDLVVTGHDTEAARRLAAPRTSSTTRLRDGDAVPAFELVDQHDVALTAADLQGHQTVVTFIFTRCPLPEFCPLMVKRFRELQQAVAGDAALARRVRLLSVTLDPAYDTPEVLEAFGTSMKADFTRWRFVTGTEEQIGAFAKAFAVYTERNGPSLDHTLATALIGPDGRVVEIWRGSGWTTDEVLTALRTTGGS